MLAPAASFVLPNNLIAKEPPEIRGLPRDHVRLLVVERDSLQMQHARFFQLGDFLVSGDLLVFNNSRTIPASLNGREIRSGSPVEIRLAEHLPDDSWFALLLSQVSAQEITIANGIRVTVISPHPRIPRLWKIRFSVPASELLNTIYRNGHPIRYEYVTESWNLGYYQTIYGVSPGSAEMPSAGRAFTWKLLFDLKRNGIEMTSITLHATLSSYMDDRVDAQHFVAEEEYWITKRAAEKINQSRMRNRRVIAVGTTVVRALESAAKAGSVQPIHGYTSLRIDSNHSLRVVDSLLTGFHEPEASHLDLLTAFLPAPQIKNVYQEALAEGYLWHEFGDLNLIL